MSFWRAVLAIVFPPLSVVDKGCGTVLIIFFLTILDGFQALSVL